MTPITIFHNPACGTSRNVLALIRDSGVEPRVAEYLQQPPSRDVRVRLLAPMQMPVRTLLRRKGTACGELGLDAPHWTDEQLPDFIRQHPILMNRPVEVTPLGKHLCRPSKTVRNLLPGPRRGAFNKEDGEPVIDAEGRRVAR